MHLKKREEKKSKLSIDVKWTFNKQIFLFRG